MYKINMSSLVRKLKINSVTSVEFSEEEKKIIEYLDNIFNDLIFFQHNENSKHYFFENKCILIFSDNLTHVKFSSEYTSQLKYFFNIALYDFYEILKYYIIKFLDIKVETVGINFSNNSNVNYHYSKKK
jgi:hypothetical protein